MYGHVHERSWRVLSFADCANANVVGDASDRSTAKSTAMEQILLLRYILLVFNSTTIPTINSVHTHNAWSAHIGVLFLINISFPVLVEYLRVLLNGGNY